MKRILLILSVLVAGTVFGQNVPQGINYQAVARNNNGSLLANTTLAGVRFSILSSVSPDVVQYQEVHNNVPTNQFGLFTRVIGQGTQTGGLSANFASIPWGASQCYIKIEVDQSGWIDMGTLPFWAVPYAFVAGNVVNGGVGPTGPQGANGANGINGATGPTGPQGIQGPQGPAGADGATGPAGAQGPAGATGAQGPQGPAGADGAQGPAGPQGPAGADGAQGPAGPQGPAGADGATGPAGAQGPAGATGAQGPQGPAGADGATGANGPTGPTGFLQNGDSAGDTPYWDGSAWVTTNDNIYNNGGNVGIGNSSPATKLEVGGTLTLDATTPQEGGEIIFNQGSLAGPGQFVFDNFYSFSGGNKLRLFHTLGATNNFVMMDNGNIGIGGFQWFDQPSSPLHVKGTLRVEDGTQQAGYIFTSDANGNGSWQAPSGLQGPTGPQGDPGPAGPAGAQGPQGVAGPAGPAGADGATGATGPQGPAGAQGPQGIAGPAGADGATGATGPQGPAGAQGPQGVAGPAGADGATGATGPQGPAGANGATGAQGPQGVAGATGPQGPAGATGAQGPAGANGATGAQGPQGPTGPGGTSLSAGVNEFTFFPSSSGPWLNVQTLTLTTTTTGPVFVEANGSSLNFADLVGYRIMLDGTTFVCGGIADQWLISGGENQWLWSIGARIPSVTAGTHTYTLQMAVSDSNLDCQIVEGYFYVNN